MRTGGSTTKSTGGTRRWIRTVPITRWRRRGTTIPAPGLRSIQAPLPAINLADDPINPLALGIVEREIKVVPHGLAILVPTGNETIGHGTHTKAVV
jgi:hypothetical protein